MAAVDDERFALLESADVVGVHDVAVPGSLAAEAGVVEGVRLLRPLQDPLGPGEGGDLVGLLELVGDDRSDGAGQPVADCVVGAEAGPGLRDEDHGDVEAAGPLHQVDGGAGPVRELREFVDDDEGLAVRVLAGEGPVQNVLQEEGADLGGLVAVLGSADGDVSGSGVFVGPGAVEGGADGPGDAVVAGPDTGDVLVGERADGLECLGVVAGGPLEGSLVETGDELRERAGLVTDGVAEDGAGDAFVVRLGERLRSEEPVDDGFGVASPAVERLAAAVSGAQAGRVGEGQEGVAGDGVGFAVDPVDVPPAAEGFAGQGQGGDRLAAACLADDQGLAPPGVERGGDDGPASLGEPPVPDVSAGGRPRTVRPSGLGQAARPTVRCAWVRLRRSWLSWR